MEGAARIMVLKSGAIAALVKEGQLQPDLFDERNLISLTSENYPGERLVACRNRSLRGSAAKRKELIAATERALEKVAAMAAAGRLSGRDKIGVRVGKVIAKYKVGSTSISISRMPRSPSASMKSAPPPKRPWMASISFARPPPRLA